MPAKCVASEAGPGHPPGSLVIKCPYCPAVIGVEWERTLNLRASVTTAEAAASVTVELTFKRPVTFTCACRRELMWTPRDGAPRAK